MNSCNIPRLVLWPGLILSACALLSACGSGQNPADAEPVPSLTVTAVAAAAREVERSITVSGSVAAWQEMSLGVELTGVRAAEVLVEVGDQVRRGQPLLRLDTRTLEVQARQADASVAQAHASLELARSKSVRGETLLQQGLISSSDADQLRADLLRAEAQLTTANADRDAARLRLGFATLQAPDAGVISLRAVQPGQVISAGEELLRLIRQGRLEWRAELTENDLTRVATGAAVELNGPRGEVISGRVRAVSPALNIETRTGLLYADLPNPGDLRAGMFAQGRIVLSSGPAHVLPRESIVVRDGYPYVFVLQPLPGAGGDSAVMQVAQRRIVAGVAQGALIEIISGLTAGERVVQRGAGFLSNGDVVRVVADEAAPGDASGTGGPAARGGAR